MKFGRFILAGIVVLFVVCLASFVPLSTIAQNISSTVQQVIILSSLPVGAPVDSTVRQVVINSGNATGIQTTYNNNATGTTLNRLACTAAVTAVQDCSGGATQGMQGITVAGAGTNGTVKVQTTGVASCTFSGGITYGDYAQIDATSSKCVDGGAAYPTTGGEVVGTIVSPTNGSAGLYLVNLFGPDVANTGGGTGSVNAPTEAGDTGYYATTAKKISSVAHEIHAGTGTLYAAFASCPASGGCDVIADPGQTYTLNSPLWVGGLTLPQTLTIKNATINCSDTATGPVDDCIVIGPLARLTCTQAGNPSLISATSTAQLNSVVTTIGGVILDAWQAAHAYSLNQVVLDSNSHTQQVTVAGTSQTPGPPTWTNTGVGGITSDGTVTWTEIAAGTLSSATQGSELTIDGCHVNGNTSATAKINNVLRISGVNGGLGVIRNVTVGQLSTGGVAAGVGSFSNGMTGLLIDDGQDNLQCTASHAPNFCCTGAGTGTCQSGAGGHTVVAIKVTGLFLAPGIPNGNGPAYGVLIAGHTSGGLVKNVAIDTSQIADISGSNNVALLAVDGSGAGGVSNVSIDNTYFENGSTAVEGGSDIVLDKTAQELYLRNVNFTPNNGTLTNCIHVVTTGGTALQFVFHGKIFNSPCTNAIKNDVSSQTLVLGSLQDFDYDWNQQNAVGAMGYMVDGNMLLTGEQLAGFAANVTGGNETANLATANPKFTLNANGIITFTNTAPTIVPAPSATQRYPYRFQVCQNGTGNFTLGFAVGTGVTALQWSGGSQPGYTLTALNGDFYSCLFDGTNLNCKEEISNVPC